MSEACACCMFFLMSSQTSPPRELLRACRLALFHVGRICVEVANGFARQLVWVGEPAATAVLHVSFWGLDSVSTCSLHGSRREWWGHTELG